MSWLELNDRLYLVSFRCFFFLIHAVFSNLRTATKNIEGILASLPSTTLRAPLEYLKVLRFSDPQCRTSTIDVQVELFYLSP